MPVRLIVLLVGLLPALVSAQCFFDPLDQSRVIKASAESFPAARSQPLQTLSVMHFKEGRFQPVAFQIDERDEVGQVWFPESGFDRDGEAGRFEGRDQLLLMLTDAGERAPEDAQPEEGSVISRLEVANGCYFYLVADNPARSENFYVAHDPETGKTRTALYQLNVEPSNELNWQYLGYKSYQGKGSIIDTLKMRMSAGVLSRFTRMTLDNHNLKPRQVGHLMGPIRSVMHLRTRVVLAGIPVMTLQVQVMRYASHFEAHTYARVPDLYRATLKNPEVQVTVDGNAQYGAHVYTAAFADKPVVVNGKVNEQDQRFAEQSLSMEENWILFDSGKQFSILTSLDMPDELAEVPLGVTYQDDAELEVSPEQYPGQLPNLGYALRGWPDPQHLHFSVSLFFDKGLHEMAPADYASQRGDPVPVTVTPLLPGF